MVECVGVDESRVKSQAAPPDATAVRRELERIIASDEFRSSARRTKLLSYLVEKAIAGEPVKEYGIGVDVFDKPESYDPRTDPSVRVEIGRVRSRLSAYYANGGGADPVRIEIPRGSYLPVIEPAGLPVVETDGGPDAAVHDEGFHRTAAQPRRNRRRSMLYMAVAALLTALGLGWYFELSRRAIDSVVVLPFANLTGDPNDDYLADGVTEGLTDALAQAPQLRVVARTSAFQFKGRAADIRDIGRRVNAGAVIEGSLRLQNGEFWLTMQVNRARDGYHILSRTFRGAPSELGRLESEMAAPALAAIRPGAAIAARRAPDPQAYDLLLKARALRGDGTRESFENQLRFLNRAIERDPSYADAYAMLAGAYSGAAMNFADEPLDFGNHARAAARKAIELDGNSAQAYAALGSVDGMIFLDWKRGEGELRRALRLMPQSAAAHNHLGLLLTAQGRFPEALRELRAAESLDPLVAAPGATVGVALYASRDFDGALAQFERVFEHHPEAAVLHGFIGMAWEGKRRFDQAAAEYFQLEKTQPEIARSYQAQLYAATGRRAEARRLLDVMEHPAAPAPPNAFDIAAVYSALGDRDAAFQWLDRAYQQRKVWFLEVHPMLDPLRSDPRFTALLRKCGFSD